MKENKVLNPQQEIFCVEYCTHGDSAKAYAEAYNRGEWKRGKLSAAASRLLGLDHVQFRIKEIRGQYVEVGKLNRAKIVEILERVVLADITEYLEVKSIDVFDGKGGKGGKIQQLHIKELAALTPEQRQIISTFDLSKGVIKLGLLNKEFAINKLLELLRDDEGASDDTKGGAFTFNFSEEIINNNNTEDDTADRG